MNAADRFTRCLGFVLQAEGDFVDRADDRGGPTCKGVTLKTLSAHLGRPATVQELKLMPASLVSDIYRAGFWTPVRGDDLFAGIDLFVFDSGVNCGPARAARWLQHALGVVEDGAIGVMTLRALADASDPMLIEDMRQQREAHYRSQPQDQQDAFLKGWLNRLEKVADLATSWAQPSRPAPPLPDSAIAAVQAAIASRGAQS